MKNPMKLCPFRPATRAGQNANATQMMRTMVHQSHDVVASISILPLISASIQGGAATSSITRCGLFGVKSWQTALVDDEELLARAEEALTEIKVGQGLSERHEAVLAALRIRLKGSAGKSLEEMLEAADDPAPDVLAEKLAEADRAPKRSLDDLFAEPKPKPDWPS
jgi:hypothetical protein